MAMTDAMCTPERRQKEEKNLEKQKETKNCTTSTVFFVVVKIYEFLLAEALALFSCCFSLIFSPLI